MNKDQRQDSISMKILQVLLIALAICLPSQCLSKEITGKVVNVADGDTITVHGKDKRQHKIRLYGIDTPEKSQAFGNAAKKYTSKLTAGKNAEVTSYDIDKYGRTVGVVMVNGTNVNQSLIEAGYAWQYRKYCKASFCKDWIGLEQKARNSKKGLWADPEPIAPWDYRKDIASSSASSKTSKAFTASTGGFHGNIKSHVFHASSCRYYDCKNCVQGFRSRQEAVDSGYRPCGTCKP